MLWRATLGQGAVVLQRRISDFRVPLLDGSLPKRFRFTIGVTSPTRYVPPKDRSPKTTKMGALAGRRYFKTAAGSLAAE